MYHGKGISEMCRGLSHQQNEILELLKKDNKYGLCRWTTREIVLTLHPETSEYLSEVLQYSRYAHHNFMSDDLEQKYQEHFEKLKKLPNYHTIRTATNRALRGLVKRGLVVQHPWMGLYQKQGLPFGWMLPEHMNDRFKVSTDYLELLEKIYG